jgi:DNA-binding CsgD family transcriptional regulator
VQDLAQCSDLRTLSVSHTPDFVLPSAHGTPGNLQRCVIYDGTRVALGEPMQPKIACEPRFFSAAPLEHEGDRARQRRALPRTVYKSAACPKTVGDWLAEVAVLAQPSLDRGLGLLACSVRLDEEGIAIIEELVLIGGPGIDSHVPFAASLVERVALAAATLFSNGEVALWSERCVADLEAHAPRSELAGGAELGVIDYLAIRVAAPEQPSASAIFLIVPSGDACKLNQAEHKLLTRIACHLRSAMHLHRAVHARLSDAVAHWDTLELLQQLKRSDLCEPTSPEQTKALWRGLIDCRWSLLAYADSGEKRLVLARRNDADCPVAPALSQRERGTALLAVLGSSTKHVAYELGIALSTASTLLASAIRKLGLQSRVELIEILGFMAGRGQDHAPHIGSLARQPAVESVTALEAAAAAGRISARCFDVGNDAYVLFEMRLRRLAPPACLTDAERDVVNWVLAEKSNAEIARARRTSMNTVANQLHAVYLKLGISGRAQLMASC